MKYYIATKLDNAAQHNLIRDILDHLGHQITYDWTAHGPVYDRGPRVCVEVAEKELRGVTTADFVIVLKPGGRGTHVEFGAALGCHIPIICLTTDREDYTPAPATCIFYYHESVRKVKSVKELLEAVKSLTP